MNNDNQIQELLEKCNDINYQYPHYYTNWIYNRYSDDDDDLEENCRLLEQTKNIKDNEKDEILKALFGSTIKETSENENRRIRERIRRDDNIIEGFGNYNCKYLELFFIVLIIFFIIYNNI